MANAVNADHDPEQFKADRCEACGGLRVRREYRTSVGPVVVYTCPACAAQDKDVLSIPHANRIREMIDAYTEVERREAARRANADDDESTGL